MTQRKIASVLAGLGIAAWAFKDELKNFLSEDLTDEGEGDQTESQGEGKNHANTENDKNEGAGGDDDEQAAS